MDFPQEFPLALIHICHGLQRLFFGFYRFVCPPGTKPFSIDHKSDCAYLIFQKGHNVFFQFLIRFLFAKIMCVPTLKCECELSF